MLFSLGKRDLQEINVGIHNVPESVSCSTGVCRCKMLERVNNIKYLGALMDEHLNFKLHVGLVIRKIRFGLFALTRLKSSLGNSSFLRTCYFSYVQSHLQYGISIWGGVYKQTLRPLVLLQKRIIRVVTASGYRDHTLPLFQRAHIMNLNQLYAYNILLYAWRNDLIAELDVTQSTRVRRFVYSFTPHSTRLLQSFHVHLVKLLNAFPNVVTALETKDVVRVKNIVCNADLENILLN